MSGGWPVAGGDRRRGGRGGALGGGGAVAGPLWSPQPPLPPGGSVPDGRLWWERLSEAGLWWWWGRGGAVSRAAAPRGCAVTVAAGAVLGGDPILVPGPAPGSAGRLCGPWSHPARPHPPRRDMGSDSLSTALPAGWGLLLPGISSDPALAESRRLLLCPVTRGTRGGGGVPEARSCRVVAR